MSRHLQLQSGECWRIANLTPGWESKRESKLLKSFHFRQPPSASGNIGNLFYNGKGTIRFQAEEFSASIRQQNQPQSENLSLRSGQARATSEKDATETIRKSVSWSIRLLMSLVREKYFILLLCHIAKFFIGRPVSNRDTIPASVPRSFCYSYLIISAWDTSWYQFFETSAWHKLPEKI